MMEQDSGSVNNAVGDALSVHKSHDTEAMAIDDKLESNGTGIDNGVYVNKIPELNNGNIIEPCDNTECVQQEESEEIKENNENSVTNVNVSSNENNVEVMITGDSSDNIKTINEPNTSSRDAAVPMNNVEVMVTGESPESSKVINETNSDSQNSAVSTNNVEAMVTGDSSECLKLIKETNKDSENNVVSDSETEGNRISLILDAMNKDQTWKTDRVYQKDLSSLKLLCDYGSDSDEDNNENKTPVVDNLSESVVSSVPVVNPCPAVSKQQEYRKPEVLVLTDSEEDSDDSSEDETTSSSSTATSSSSSDESDDTDNNSENECVIVEEKKPAIEVPKTKGELGLEDLPPIEDLHISVPEEECVEIGKVLSIVDTLVVVQSIKGCPALDLDSVLFLDHGHNTLGQVFDVFGKVGEACYCVRFNSKDHAIEKGVEIGMPVYYAPRTEHSKFVFLADLMKMKGSDASWEHNNEPPPRFLDYSDDEEERRARKGDKPPTLEVEPDETQPQAKKFNKRGPKRGGGGMGRGGGGPPSPHRGGGPNRMWSTPFHRYPYPPPSPGPPPTPRSGPQPLLRPTSFRTPGPPQSHFHNAAAGALAVSPTPSPWVIPPPAVREEFSYNANMPNIPPPQSPFAHNQMSPGGMNMGGFGQPPPQFAPRAPMMATSIPGSGPFAINHGTNGFKAEGPGSFASNQPPPFRPEYNAFGSDGQGPLGARSRVPFGSQDPIFMNRNIPPPQPPQSPRW